MSSAEKRFQIFAVRTTVGQEKNVARLLSNRIDEASGEIASIFILPALRGYVFIEGLDRDRIALLTQGMMHVKSRPITAVSIEELKQHIIERPVIETINEGELVEVIAGPLRGVTGRVLRIDRQKNSVTIELTESTYPLPISVPARHLRPTKQQTTA
ncbi:MAG: transcription elongation factor Spt5 [Nitrososphaerota archaeon]|nr:transcription elongation factor Spt5 [Candidatus Calditenuaceae archaeon]MDW8072925.1 transcription elongation factor Spt5 [Nitrososphaerota archaeon]